MSWKEFIKDELKGKIPKDGWPETCNFVYGVVIRVAKYNGKYFFSCEKFYGDSYCTGACVVDIDRDLVKRFKNNVPEHAYFISPNIDASRPKEEIVDFARTFINYEVMNDPVLKEYAEGAVKLFAEAV